MVYIEINENNMVMYAHYSPFDIENGLGKTEEELLKTGYLVNEVVEAEYRKGFYHTTFYNPSTNEFSFEYAAIPMTLEEKIAEQEQAIMELSIIVGGMTNV